MIQEYGGKKQRISLLNHDRGDIMNVASDRRNIGELPSSHRKIKSEVRNEQLKVGRQASLQKPSNLGRLHQ